MRQKFVELLKVKVQQDFDFIIEQNGMFSFSGLTPEQVDRLKTSLPFMPSVPVHQRRKHYRRQHRLSV